MKGQDYESYCQYYEIGIKKIINKYIYLYDNLIVHPDAKDEIWKEYKWFNSLCKEKYMLYPDHLIDRHKVTACYIYAIVKARVLSSVSSLMKGDDTSLLLNENLAYTFGFSLLRSLILNYADDFQPTTAEQKDYQAKIKKVYENDFDLPLCSHGDYKNNFLSQLYFTWKESSYNILSLANTLYLIEVFNMNKNGLPENLIIG